MNTSPFQMNRTGRITLTVGAMLLAVVLCSLVFLGFQLDTPSLNGFVGMWSIYRFENKKAFQELPGDDGRLLVRNGEEGTVFPAAYFSEYACMDREGYGRREGVRFHYALEPYTSDYYIVTLEEATPQGLQLALLEDAAGERLPISAVSDGRQLLLPPEGLAGLHASQAQAVVQQQAALPRLQAVPVSFLRYTTLLTSSEQPAAPGAVQHETYDPLNQPADWRWTSAVMDALGEQLGDSPVLFADSYTFDLDGDGAEELLLVSRNFNLLQPEDTPSDASAKGATALYEVTLLFSSTLGDHVIASWCQPVGRQGSPLSYAGAADGGAELLAYQSDAAGKTIALAVSCAGDPPLPAKAQPLPADVDGDLFPELVIGTESLYGPLLVYERDGTSVRLAYTIYQPA